MRSVTVVDDEPMSLDVVARMTRAWHYECQTARNAEEALTLLEQKLTPIVITDLRMPGHGGVWLVREIQRRWPDVSVIVLTAGHDDDSLAQCIDAGAHHFFLKPVPFDELQHALEFNLKAYRTRREVAYRRHWLEATLARRTRRLRITYLSAIDSLVRTIEARDPYISGHSMRVRKYALQLAKQMGMLPRLQKKLSLAAKLHDIGKVGLPEGILNKSDSLTPEEFEEVRKHPEIGERILTPIIRSGEVLAAIRGHHERFDGAGYPDGLAGDKIPLLARVLAVADCFDALTSSRAYRDALTAVEAIELIRQGSGSQFDPELVPLFLRSVASV